MTDSRKRTLTVIFGLAVTAGLFYALNAITPLFADDYSYSYTFAVSEGKYRIESLYHIYLSQLNHYRVINGRTVAHVLAQLFLMWGKPVFNVINTLAFLALGFAMYFAAFGTFKNLKPLPLFAGYILIWFASPAFGQSFLWLTGACNYLYCVLIILLFLMPYRSDAPDKEHTSVPLEAAKALLMLIFGVIAGWTNESACLALLSSAVLLTARRLLMKRKLRAWMVTGLIGGLIGCGLLLLSPGQASRLEGVGGLGSVWTWFTRFPEITLKACMYLFVPGMIGIILLVISIRQSRGKKLVGWITDVSVPLIWLCAALISAYSMAAAPYFPDRAWCAPTVFASVTVVSLYARVKPFKTVRISTVAVCILLALTYFGAFADIHNTFEAHNRRVEYIEEQKAAGETSVTIAPIYGHSKYNCYEAHGDLSSDSSVWPNTALAMYFELESVSSMG